MDASVSRLVDVYADNLVARNRADAVGSARPEEVDVDDLFAELENEDDGALRDRRLAQLQRELNDIHELKNKEHGEYTDIKSEKSVLEITTTTPRVVAHFYHQDFRRCQIIDQHLETLAKKHFQTKFIKVDVDNAPFLVVSLKVQVLPCIIAFVDGIGVDRVVGFDDLGNTDDFSTARLEYRLIEAGVILRPRIVGETKPSTIFGFNGQHKDHSSENDSDYD